jgi:hypothetical protein
MELEFRYKLIERKTTNPETLNRLRRLMMSFEQVANQVMPEFRIHLEEVNADSSHN